MIARAFLLGTLLGLALGLTAGALWFGGRDEESVPPPVADPAPVLPDRASLPEVFPARLPREGEIDPQPPGSKAGGVKEVGTDALLDELEEKVRQGGPPGGARSRLQLVVGALARRQARVPRFLVDLLLDHPDPYFRGVGAFLMRLTESPPVDRLRELVLAEDPFVRYVAAGAAGMLAGKHAAAREALRLASGDPDLRTRRWAMEWIARSSGLPEFRDILVAGLRDPDYRIQFMAEGCVEDLGESGARYALDALVAGQHSEEYVFDLVSAVVQAGHAGELLDRKLPPETTAALVDELADLARRDPGAARMMAGRFEDFLAPVLRASDGDAVEELFTLAALAGEAEFLADCARSSTLTSMRRRMALEEAFEQPALRSVALGVAADLLCDPTTPRSLRMDLVDLLGDRDAPPAAREILLRVAASDPDSGVRAEAENELR